MKLIDTTNMCSHLQRKLFAPDGENSTAAAQDKFYSALRGFIIAQLRKEE